MSILITGASGFIGSNVLKQLSAQQQGQTYCLTRNITREQRQAFPRVTWVKGDISDYSSLMKLPDDISHIMHIAGSTSMWLLKEAEQLATNVRGTENICRFAMERNVEKMVFTSSVVSFGVHDFKPNEDTVSNAGEVPVNYYQTKVAAEIVVKRYALAGLKAVILNPTVVIGPDDKVGWSRLIKMTARNLMPMAGKGSADFANVSEVAKAHITALLDAKVAGSYILGGPEHSNLEFLNEIRRQLGKSQNKLVAPQAILSFLGLVADLLSYVTRVEPPITKSAAFILGTNLSADDSRARRDLGYKHLPMAESVSQCISWMKESGRM